MHQAAKFQFERAAREFAQWRAVPEHERSRRPGGGRASSIKYIIEPPLQTDRESGAQALVYLEPRVVDWSGVQRPWWSQKRLAR
jgi:hypothetical protein